MIYRLKFIQQLMWGCKWLVWIFWWHSIHAHTHNQSARVRWKCSLQVHPSNQCASVRWAAKPLPHLPMPTLQVALEMSLLCSTVGAVGTGEGTCTRVSEQVVGQVLSAVATLEGLPTDWTHSCTAPAAHRLQQQHINPHAHSTPPASLVQYFHLC